MASTKTYQERIAELDKKQEQLKAQKRALLARASAEERKKRTKRLIEIGGAVESVLGQPIPKEDLPKLIAFLKKQEANGSFFSKAMSSQAPDPERAPYDMQHGGHSIIKG